MAKFRFYALWLCLACILIYLIQIAVPGFTDLFVLNQSSYFQIWRFVSAIFLHASPAHLIFNLFALALFGLILEKLIGGKKFLLIFFLSGILANVVAVNFYPASLGASGAIYGILGCLAFIRPTMPVFAFGLPMPMFIAAILWIIAAVLGIFVPSTTGDIAHLSGIAVGFIYGLFLRLRRKEIKNNYGYKVKIPEDYMRAWEERYMRV